MIDIVDTGIAAGTYKTLTTAVKTAGSVEALKIKEPFWINHIWDIKNWQFYIFVFFTNLESINTHAHFLFFKLIFSQQF